MEASLHSIAVTEPGAHVDVAIFSEGQWGGMVDEMGLPLYWDVAGETCDDLGLHCTQVHYSVDFLFYLPPLFLSFWCFLCSLLLFEFPAHITSITDKGVAPMHLCICCIIYIAQPPSKTMRRASPRITLNVLVSSVSNQLS